MNEVEAGRMPDIDPIPVAAVDREPQFSGMLNRLGIDLSDARDSFKTKQDSEELPHPTVETGEHDFSGMLSRLGIDPSKEKQELAKPSDAKPAARRAPERPKAPVRRRVTDVAQPERVKPERRKLRPLHVGAALLALAGIIPGSLVAADALGSSDRAPQAQVAAPFPPETEAPPTTETTTPTTEAPTTSTTEAVELIEFRAGHGEWIGTLKIEALCLEVEVYGFSELEKLDTLTNENGQPVYNPNVIGDGRAVIDRLKVLPVPGGRCETVEQREAEFEAKTGQDYVTRFERGGPMAYLPVAGHEQGWDGGFLSVFPGQPGNTVMAGHGSTKSAPFADIGLLKPGDRATFERSDGNSFTYEVLETEILPNDNFEPFLNYSAPDGNPSTATIYRCGDLNGLPGSAAARFAARLGLVQQ